MSTKKKRLITDSDDEMDSELGHLSEELQNNTSPNLPTESMTMPKDTVSEETKESKKGQTRKNARSRKKDDDGDYEVNSNSEEISEDEMEIASDENEDDEDNEVVKKGRRQSKRNSTTKGGRKNTATTVTTTRKSRSTGKSVKVGAPPVKETNFLDSAPSFKKTSFASPTASTPSESPTSTDATANSTSLKIPKKITFYAQPLPARPSESNAPSSVSSPSTTTTATVTMAQTTPPTISSVTSTGTTNAKNRKQSTTKKSQKQRVSSKKKGTSTKRKKRTRDEYKDIDDDDELIEETPESSSLEEETTSLSSEDESESSGEDETNDNEENNTPSKDKESEDVVEPVIVKKKRGKDDDEYKTSKHRKKSKSKGRKDSEDEFMKVSLRTKRKVNYADIDREDNEEFDEEDVLEWMNADGTIEKSEAAKRAQKKKKRKSESEKEKETEENEKKATPPSSISTSEENQDKVLERIIAIRERKTLTYRGVPNVPVAQHAEEGAQQTLFTLVPLSEAHNYEYLVKYKGKSYIHCEWVPQETIERQKMGRQRLQRFLKKPHPLDPDEPYPSDYVLVDRIIAKEIRTDETKQKKETYYLVKWQGLQYNEATWEHEKDVNDDEKIREFEQWNSIPESDVGKNFQRPPPSAFKEITTSPQYKNNNQLRPYQLEGLNWLRYCWYNRTNSILADEMGLGKTVQSVAMLDYLITTYGIRGPFLVVAPLSTIPHWQREFAGWTDINAVVYHGNAESRELIRKYEWYFTDEQGNIKTKAMYKWNVIITTYEMIIADSSIFQSIRWKYLIIDEAHRLKNRQSRIATELKQFKYDQLLLLTGTPIQNNTEELWTLLNLLDRDKFPKLETFLEEFGELKEASQVQKLHKLLKPLLLRRMKEDVEKTIAPKEETIIEVELTRVQKKYYKAIYEKNFEHLAAGRSRQNLPSLLNVMMELRKCCNHPFLVKGVEEIELTGKRTPEEINQAVIQASGKLVLIDKLLPKLKADGHKVLIFSQMVRVLDILEDYLNYRGYKHERIDGHVRGNDRQAAIDRFSRPDSDIFAFLLCTRAGGLGINLVAADTVIIFDSDWNPQNDIQAQARCHRIGQEKKVKVYRLITSKTYEKTMFERANLKLGLDQAVLNKIEDTDGGESAAARLGWEAQSTKQKTALTAAEVDSLLKYGAYAMKDDDESAQKFVEENIEQILESRTKTVVRDSIEGSSTFSKASFASEHAVPEIDVNDPDFWRKIMPEAYNKPNPSIIEEPRPRKQVRRFEYGMESESSVESDKEEIPVPEEDSDQLYTDEEEAEKKEKEKKKEVAVRKEGWSIVHRNRFQKALLNFGFGRWEKIREAAKLKQRSLEDIALFALAYLRKLMVFAGETCEKSVIERILNIDPNESSKTIQNVLPFEMKSNENVTSQTALIVTETLTADDKMVVDSVATATATTTTTTDNSSKAESKDEKFVTLEKQTTDQTTAMDVDVNQKITSSQTETSKALIPDEKHRNVQTEVHNLAPNTTSEQEQQSQQQSQQQQQQQQQQSQQSQQQQSQSQPQQQSSAPSDAADTTMTTTTATITPPPDPSRKYDNDPSLNEPKFLELVQKNARTTLKRLELLAELGDIVRSNFEEFGDKWPRRPFEGYPKWTKEDDKNLLRGAYKHGIAGRFDRIKQDPDLGFVNKTLADYEDPNDEKKKEAKKDKSKETSKESDEKKNEGDTTQSEKTTVLATDTSPPNETSPIESKTDQMETDTIATEKKETKNEEKKDEWIPWSALQKRIRYLLKRFSKMRRKMERHRRREDDKHIKEPKHRHKHERKQKVIAEWSKRERNDFYRTIITYGVPTDPVTGEPNFEFVQEKAKLSYKNVAQISRYYTEFLTACKIIKTAHQNEDKTKKQAKAKAKGAPPTNPTATLSTTSETPSTTEAKMSDAVVSVPSSGLNPETVTSSTPAPSASLPESAPPPPPLSGPLAEAAEKEKEFGLTYAQAKRAFDRITMFLTLRKKVLKMSEEELQSRFRYLGTKQAKLPSWWSSQVHDLGLLKAVDKWGYGRWADVCSDPELPFMKTLEKFEPLPSNTTSNVPTVIAPTEQPQPQTKQEQEPAPSPQQQKTSEQSLEVNEKVNTSQNWRQEEEKEAKGNTVTIPKNAESAAATPTPSTTTDKKETLETGDDSDDDSSKEEETKPGAHLAKYMPKEKILWKRLTSLIKIATETKLNFPKIPGDPNRLKQATIGTGENSALVLQSKEELDDSREVDRKEKKRKADDDFEPESKKRRINSRSVEVSRDNEGNIIFPIRVGNLLSIIDLGRVVYDREAFHSDKYIWPVGFKSVRIFQSAIDPEERALYTCEILDGGDKPLFRVTPSDDPENYVEAASASSAWKTILNRINEAKPAADKRASVSVSGPEYFGFGVPTVAELIAQLPDADKCIHYRGIDASAREQKIRRRKKSSSEPDENTLIFEQELAPRIEQLKQQKENEQQQQQQQQQQPQPPQQQQPQKSQEEKPQPQHSKQSQEYESTQTSSSLTASTATSSATMATVTAPLQSTKATKAKGTRQPLQKKEKKAKMITEAPPSNLPQLQITSVPSQQSPKSDVSSIVSVKTQETVPTQPQIQQPQLHLQPQNLQSQSQSQSVAPSPYMSSPITFTHATTLNNNNLNPSTNIDININDMTRVAPQSTVQAKLSSVSSLQPLQQAQHQSHHPQQQHIRHQQLQQEQQIQHHQQHQHLQQQQHQQQQALSHISLTTFPSHQVVQSSLPSRGVPQSLTHADVSTPQLIPPAQPKLTQTALFTWLGSHPKASSVTLPLTPAQLHQLQLHYQYLQQQHHQQQHLHQQQHQQQQLQTQQQQQHFSSVTQNTFPLQTSAPSNRPPPQTQ